MKEKWTGEIIGKMHINEITMLDIAKEMNVSKSYVCMILNGNRKPPMAKERIHEAFNAIIERRASDGKRA